MRSVGVKIMFPISIIGILFFAFMGIQYATMEENQKSVEEMSEKYYRTVELADELKLSVVQVQQWLTDISATRGAEGFDDGFDEAEVYAEKVGEVIEELKTLNPEHKETLQEITEKFTPYYAAGKEMARRILQGGRRAVIL